MLSTHLLALVLVPSLAAPVAFPTTASLDTSLDGVLESTDRVSSAGAFVDDHAIDVLEGQLLTVVLRSSRFAGRIRARSPEGQVFEAAATHPRESAELEVWAPVSGSWVVEVTSARAGQKGEYVLDMGASGSALPAEGWPTGFVELGWLGEPEDDVLDSGEYVDVFVLSGRAGDLVEVDLRAEFDPYLALVAPSGELITNQDAPGSERGSKISARLPASGQYTIAVTSEEARVTGAYTVRIEVDRPSASGADGLTVS